MNIERMEMTAHVGTHIDALGHFSIGNRLYNGVNAEEAVTDWGLNRLGIEHAPPMVTRGILLDVAGLDGGEHLEPGRVITPEDLQNATAAANVTIEPGDIVMIRTGWGRLFGIDNPRYVAGEPGIDVPAARWLTEQGVVAVGCDNMAVEVLPNPNKALSMPVHQHLLVEAGVYIIENLALEELAKENLSSFCFILLATKYKGATGCPVFNHVRHCVVRRSGACQQSGLMLTIVVDDAAHQIGNLRGQFLMDAGTEPSAVLIADVPAVPSVVHKSGQAV